MVPPSVSGLLGSLVVIFLHIWHLLNKKRMTCNIFWRENQYFNRKHIIFNFVNLNLYIFNVFGLYYILIENILFNFLLLIIF